MRFYLSSYGVGDRGPALQAMATGRTLGFVPNALDDAELTTQLNSTGTVTIGRSSDGTGAVDLDPVDLSTESFDLVVVGGDFNEPT